MIVLSAMEHMIDITYKNIPVTKVPWEVFSFDLN